MQGSIKLKVNINEGFLASEIQKRGLYDVYIDGLLDIADEFQQGSPIGATRELIQGWEVTRPKKEAVTFNIKASIVNTSDRAANRIAGRGPGKAPPIQPLIDWTIAKGLATSPKNARGIAFAIRKKIMREGTERYKAGDNWVGINTQGDRISGGRIEQAEKELAAKLAKL